MKGHRWRDPRFWFVLLLGLGVGSLVSAALGRKTSVTTTGFSVVGAVSLLGVLIIGLGAIFYDAFLKVHSFIGRVRDKEERGKIVSTAKAQFTVYLILGGVVLALIAVAAGADWLYEDYRSGTSLLRVPEIGEYLAAGRLRDWPKVLGEEARDVTVDRCDRAHHGFICFLKKLDADGSYRTIPCYFDGTAVGRKSDWVLTRTIEEFCADPGQP